MTGRRFDILVAVAFVVLGVLFQLGRTGGRKPVTSLSSDAANITSFAAALDHPDMFRGDGLLSEPQHFAFYFTIHVPLTRVWGRCLGDYGSGFIAFLWLHVAAQGVGFYLLALRLWERRGWALVASAALMIPSGATIGARFAEGWGAWHDALPRFTFQALLPFILLAALRGRRLSVMVAVGLMMYVHPVSAPAWAVALWAGLWLERRSLAGMVGLGAVFVALAVPFAFVYLGNHEHRPETDVALIREIMNYRFSSAFSDLRTSLWEELVAALRAGLLPLGVLGAAVALKLADVEERRRVTLVAVWATTLAVVCGAVPLADEAVARWRGAAPLQVDLVRGLRYLTPLMLLTALWPIVLADRGGPARRAACVLAAAVVLFFGVRSKGQLLARFVVDEVAALAHGHLYTGQGNFPEGHACVLEVARRTAPGERVYVYSENLSPLAIRYAAFRPVPWCRKDGGALAYSDHAALKDWYRIALREDAITKLPPAARRDAAATLARELGARWLVIDVERVPTLVDLGTPPPR